MQTANGPWRQRRQSIDGLAYGRTRISTATGPCISPKMPDAVVITGAAGFVGRHLASALRQTLGPDIAIYGWSLGRRDELGEGVELRQVDITEAGAVDAELARVKPVAIFHLAGSARSSQGADEVIDVWRTNLGGTANLGRSILANCPKAWLLNVSSGLIYGNSAPDAYVGEEGSPAPIGAYAAAKYGAEVVLNMMCAAGLQVVHARPFNHSGPGQSESFFLPALISRVLNLRNELEAGALPVRSADHQRDFLHVEDVAACYVALFLAREKMASGSVFNVCSGQPVRVGEIARFVLDTCGLETCAIVSEGSAADTDLKRLVGDGTKVAQIVGWRPKRTWRDMALDALAWERNRRV